MQGDLKFKIIFVSLSSRYSVKRFSLDQELAESELIVDKPDFQPC